VESLHGPFYDRSYIERTAIQILYSGDAGHYRRVIGLKIDGKMRWAAEQCIYGPYRKPGDRADIELVLSVVLSTWFFEKRMVPLRGLAAGKTSKAKLLELPETVAGNLRPGLPGFRESLVVRCLYTERPSPERARWVQARQWSGSPKKLSALADRVFTRSRLRTPERWNPTGTEPAMMSSTSTTCFATFRISVPQAAGGWESCSRSSNCVSAQPDCLILQLIRLIIRLTY